ncbi:molybdenum cofactor guanylyltransferase [Lederbergia citrea]|uniref:molybdenum cofactor guanylyltransferase n=1 Tax=Lederbergia citrea TaxID=2833581 RepID=UPI001BC9926E|nr:molybdenum cofactor guanylyltransferase [Lederbergia citrea]MBS4177991.1 molybdenum cofactor guanylyltransferase [Lederbergia citrea]
MKTIILAGGKSSRMGENKALMKIDGVRVIDRIISEFTPVSEKIILIANDKTMYDGLQAELLEDAAPYAGQGPLAGIYTGLLAASEGPCIIVACDMPFASSEFGLKLIETLIENKRDAVVPVTEGQIHPLFAAYEASIAEKVKMVLNEGKRSVRSLLDQLNVEFFKMDTISETVWNMNTQEDYIEAVKIAERGGRNEL